jgi:hypothetical protein
MILFQIDPQYLAVLPLEGDALWTVDVNTVPGRFPLKAMEVETWYVQVNQGFGVIQGFQAPQTASLQVLPYPTAATTLEQICQSFMSETSDHVVTVT